LAFFFKEQKIIMNATYIFSMLKCASNSLIHRY
jgi:hypothetical protein